MRYKELIYWVLLWIATIIIFSGCSYQGTITKYGPDDQLLARYTFESNQPMLMKAGDLQSDSRIKPLIESLMLELGYKKETGHGDSISDNDNFNWGEN